MYRTSVEIYEEKKKKLRLGDQAVKMQVGEGRDIMSVLCAYESFVSNIMLSRILIVHLIPPVKENMIAEEEDRLPDEELVGQIS